MGVPGVAVQPAGEGNSGSAIRFLIEWVSDGEAGARRYLAAHAEPGGASLVTAHGRGACQGQQPLRKGMQVTVDDELIIWLTKDLAG